MQTTAGDVFDETVTRLLSEGDDLVTYEDLFDLAGRYVDAAESRCADPALSAASRQRLVQLARHFDRRKFAAFRAAVKPRSACQKFLVELFLQTRIKLHTLAYLSVQEGEEFEGAAAYPTAVPQFLSHLLSRLGTRSNCTLSPGIGRWRVPIQIDPLVHLRKAYGVMLVGSRRGGVSRRGRVVAGYHRLMFRAKTRLAALVTRAGRQATFRSGSAAGVRETLRRPLVRRLLAMAVMVLFPTARRLSEANWTDLLCRIEEYFAPRVAGLLAVIPEESVRNHGLIKLFKVAFGTVAGRTSVRAAHEPGEVDFIFNTLRLAYSWGVTYPLVDNVLDSAATAPAVKAELNEMLQGLFRGTQPVAPNQGCDPGVREVYHRLAEVISLTPPASLGSTRRALGHLLEAHHRDSQRRLSALNPADLQGNRAAVMADTALKAALVRLATMHVCGIEVDAETRKRSIVASLFNQFGDDLWDIYEDMDDDRVTPFTLYLKCGGDADPFRFYLAYAALISRHLSRRRQVAMFMGVAETLRDTVLALEQRGSDPLGVGEAVKDSCAVAQLGHEFINGVPHVDFDAVLFALEDAITEVLA